MNSANHASTALASLIAILAQSTQTPAQQNSTPQFPLVPPPHHHASAHLEPVFIEGEILDTTQWIGTNTTLWYEPKPWQLPRPIRASKELSPNKRKRSVSPVSQPTKTKIISFPTFSHALKHVSQLSQSEEFIDALRKMKHRQNNLESDLFEERCRILRKFESKRKMSELLQSLESQYTPMEVYPLTAWLMRHYLSRKKPS